MSIKREVIDEVIKLSRELPWWERLALVLLVALATVIGRRAWVILKTILPKVAPDPDPTDDPGMPPIDVPGKKWEDGEV